MHDANLGIWDFLQAFAVWRMSMRSTLRSSAEVRGVGALRGTDVVVLAGSLDRPAGELLKEPDLNRLFLGGVAASQAAAA